ncbi:MAG: hypothetical protein IKD68_08360, partial [Solobacterium sp.]|nr:hypothetical protein [Solobacterium sp.]
KKREQITTSSRTGIYFAGVVQERRKRMVPKDNPDTEVVTYTFYDDENRMSYYIDDYAPESYLEVGEYAEFPIRIKAYVHKGTGKPAYSMTIKKSFAQSARNNGNGEILKKVSGKVAALSWASPLTSFLGCLRRMSVRD